MRSTGSLKFCLIQIFVFICVVRAQNAIKTSTETVVIQLNEENPIEYLQSPGFPTKPYPKNYSVNYELKVSEREKETKNY